MMINKFSTVRELRDGQEMSFLDFSTEIIINQARDVMIRFADS